MRAFPSFFMKHMAMLVRLGGSGSAAAGPVASAITTPVMRASSVARNMLVRMAVRDRVLCVMEYGSEGISEGQIGSRCVCGTRHRGTGVEGICIVVGR
jgi:hypothetical protein